MNAVARLAALIVPVIGLGSLWGLSDHTYRQGTEWEVPIEGYDPRDFLRGHYVEFTYDWPGIEPFEGVPPDTLCFEGEAPNLARVIVPTGANAGADCGSFVRPGTSGVYGWDSLARGRLYVGQDRALALEKELRRRDQRGIVTIRQREDGSFTPIAIRFRPLTAAERAIRDAQDADDPDQRRPPAIMGR